ncbi:glutamate synthase [Pleomorphomonas diazotrophica]|uniref:Glutamate synthase n=1 Tax=Pleomorphomonas diazotrophica TaxID=1166257 RepID=A0A1I4VRT5_9HYPH|nr:glutamate synthase subunit beta [Pleomorphomonas diazotrophica]PKR89345.1 glutamate synthase [Pleomorphomonas diazotrophica]SFN03883.1 glutamate synthase (NADH) small subunit [Pleomorphomonas diazotrophica]
MGKATGFLEFERQELKYQKVDDRVRHYNEFTVPPLESDMQTQGARCMECGVPYCHRGCPVNNQIPDWNDLVYNGDWETASRNLHSTNNFPEFTGRVCPAPCEAACTLNLFEAPVTIKQIEYTIAERAWKDGRVQPEIAKVKTGKKVAVIGSGPAGLAAAQQLVRVGHDVHVYEKNARAGGLLRYGIPDFKLDKHIVERRVQQMVSEGVVFHFNVNVGVDVKIEDLRGEYDAVLLAGGSEKSRDLPVPGRELRGVHFAMEFLPQQNRRVGGEPLGSVDPISALGKRVVVIGGGDTGSDCIGTSNRQGAVSVVQLEIMPKPPEKEDKLLTWPNWPLKLRTSSSHEEGAERLFGVTATSFEGQNGVVSKVNCVEVDAKFQPVPGTEFSLDADLVLFAMGFVHPVHEGMINDLGVEKDGRGNVKATEVDYRTSVDKVFAAGDMRRGQSLVVWAIREGRQAARSIDEFLMGASVLPR